MCEIGMITPPIGINAFIVSGFTKRPLKTVFKGSAPFLISDLVNVALLLAVPQLALFLRPQRTILDNLKKTHETGTAIWIRIPVIPSVNDSKETMNNIAKFIHEEVPDVQRVSLLAYHAFARDKYTQLGEDYLLNELKSPSDEHMKDLPIT